MTKKSVLPVLGLVLLLAGLVAPGVHAAGSAAVPEASSVAVALVPAVPTPAFDEVELDRVFLDWKKPAGGFETYGRLSSGHGAKFSYCNRTRTLCPYDAVWVDVGKVGDLTMEANVFNSVSRKDRDRKYYCGYNETVICLKTVGGICRLAIKETHDSCLGGSLTVLYDDSYYLNIRPVSSPYWQDW